MEGLRVSADAVHAEFERHGPLVFLDVRSPEAWSAAALQLLGSVRLPLSDFDTLAGSLPQDRELIAYCT